MAELELFYFYVEIEYKSGYTTRTTISARNEEEMWEKFYKSHNKSKIERIKDTHKWTAKEFQRILDYENNTH